MKKTTERVFTYSAIRYSQRGKGSPAFVLFHAPASEIVAWADVDRLGPDNVTGAQRPLRELKVNKVARFLKADSANTIPTSVVIAIDPAATSFSGKKGANGDGEHGSIRLTVKRMKPGLIIDGQHRVFGAHKFQPQMNLNIVAIIDDDDAERAFQFVVINNSAARISKDHIKALNLNYDKNALNERLLKSAGLGLGMQDHKYEDLQVIDSSEPFKNLLKWPTNQDGFIPPNAIEGALAETYERAALLGVEDLELDLFLSVWTTIKSIRKGVWSKDSRLLQKVSIYSLTVYVLDSMIARQRNADEWIDFTKEDVLEAQVTRVVDRIPEEFWKTEWTAKELDTSLGRQLLLETLQIIDSNVRFRRAWYDRVSFIDPTLFVGQQYGTVKGRGVKTAKGVKKTPTKKPPTKTAAGAKKARVAKKGER